MQIHNDREERYLHILASSLGCDPFSFADWYCLYFKPDTNINISNFINHCKSVPADIDCDLIVCPTGDVFILTRETELGLYKGFCKDLGVRLDQVCVYNLFRDNHHVRLLFTAKAAPCNCLVPHECPHVFGETGALRDVLATTKMQRKSRSPQYVLLVEDDNVTRRVVSTLLKDTYAVVTAHNAQEAVSNYLLYAPDIVFLDIGLPDQNGLTVLHELKACDHEAFIVMFSGQNSLDNVIAALNAGAAGFVAKPFHTKKLHFYIDQSLVHHKKISA